MAGPRAEAAGPGLPGSEAVAGDRLIAVGADGCRFGWVAALDFGSRTELMRFAGAAELVAWREAHADRPVVAIDVPIGLPPTVGYRPCDEQACRVLGTRRMCVFQAPDRGLLPIAAYAQIQAEVARRRRTDPGARGLTKQGHGIARKIEEVDALIRGDPAREAWLIESHPEVSFRALAGQDLPAKKRAAGRDARTQLLEPEFPDVAARVEGAPWLRREVGRDDILDAYAALWSARRFAQRDPACRVLGEGERDDAGVLMRIVV